MGIEEKLLTNVLKKVKPSKHQEKQMSDFAAKLIAAAKKNGGQPMLCGSVEKGTWLADKNELDLFLLFEPSVSREDFEKKGIELAKKIIAALKGKYTVAYAEHPYLRGTVKAGKTIYTIDIVPAYNITDPSKLKSAVDRTPHHLRYIKSKLSPKIADDCRLMKVFAKASGCYGADVKTQGFSGYLCELLVINYGSFMQALSFASKWNAGVVIDIEKKWQEHEKAFEKFRAPLIVIDPVDQNRNVAAAVYPESFFKFTRAAAEFSTRPSAAFFFPREPKPYTTAEISKAVRSRGTRFYLIHFKRPDSVDDTLWPQLRRLGGALETLLSEGGFRVLRKDVWADEKECAILLELDVWQVPKIIKHTGPTIFSWKQSHAFLEHYKNHPAFIEKENWIVETPRKHVVALLLLKDLLQQPEERLLEKGVPNKIASQLKGATIKSGADFVAAAAKMPENFRIFLHKYFEKDLTP